MHDIARQHAAARAREIESGMESISTASLRPLYWVGAALQSISPFMQANWKLSR
jgi:DNA-binding transcriptional regulator YdaS (Cro superfamily)